ncbi:MAG: hypothetical protein WCO93_10615 [bacterium]
MGKCSLFQNRRFDGVFFHVPGAAFHDTVVRHTAWLRGTHSLARAFGVAIAFFFHALRAALTGMHDGVTPFHHHLMPAIVMTAKAMMFYLADAACDKTNEKNKSYYDKEPGDKSEEFTGDLFFEFCK